jgi:hypothetical protein
MSTPVSGLSGLEIILFQHQNLMGALITSSTNLKCTLNFMYAFCKYINAVNIWTGISKLNKSQFHLQHGYSSCFLTPAICPDSTVWAERTWKETVVAYLKPSTYQENTKGRDVKYHSRQLIFRPRSEPRSSGIRVPTIRPRSFGEWCIKKLYQNRVLSSLYSISPNFTAIYKKAVNAIFVFLSFILNAMTFTTVFRSLTTKQK